MHINEFKSIISTFADPNSEILHDKGKIIFSVNGELFDLAVSMDDGDIVLDDGTGPVRASKWIVRRLANLPLLATRLKESLADTKHFVPPAAALLHSLQVSPEETVTNTDDALTTTLEVLGEKNPFETSVLYITSDAGEGKTFLINQMARQQAQRYVDGKSDWLLVPIPLGGKHFLRFDDITVGALQNRYRFPFLYYDSFLALVRMGVIVPAFDGFEEMFVENSSGEAFSAMGILVSALDSRGSIVIAARKAYFEFENLKTQERLFDTIRSYSVGFGKLQLQRWQKPQFLAYCEKRNVKDAEAIYDRVSERLGETHSLLTRPVLVRRLVDIASESTSIDAFLDKIHQSGIDFFSTFVRGIIEREATEKWIDRQTVGDLASPLLTVEEHCELLSALALATWDTKVDFLKRDIFEFETDFYCESKRKSAHQTQQIRERIRGHALLIASPNATHAIEFDHEEFRLFFLGEGLAQQIRPLNEKAKSDALATLRKGILPKPVQRAFIQAIKRHPTFSRLQAAKFLLAVRMLDGQATYTQENCGNLIVRLLSEVDAEGLHVNGIAFSVDALSERKLENITFANCFFSPTSTERSTFTNCVFANCHFGQIRIYNSTKFANVRFDETVVDSVQLVDDDVEIWEPHSVLATLAGLGVIFPAEASSDIPESILELRDDKELREVQKLLRYFMRSTHIGEKLILMKLGANAQCFLDDSLPDLLDRQIMVEIDNRGGDSQRRFKLGRTLEEIDRAITNAQGSYDEFLKSFESA